MQSKSINQLTRRYFSGLVAASLFLSFVVNGIWVAKLVIDKNNSVKRSIEHKVINHTQDILLAYSVDKKSLNPFVESLLGRYETECLKFKAIPFKGRACEGGDSFVVESGSIEIGTLFYRPKTALKNEELVLIFTNFFILAVSLIACLVVFEGFMRKSLTGPIQNIILKLKSEESQELNEEDVSEICFLKETLNGQSAKIYQSSKREIRLKEAEAIASTTQMLAHDVRKPFSLVSALIDMIESTESPAELKSIVSDAKLSISSALQGVNGMIEDIMEIGRSDSNLNMEPISQSILIQECLSNIFGYSERKDISISSSLQDQYMIKGDRLKLERLMANIFGNAIEHMDEGGEIWIKSIQNDVFTTFIIGNSGSYISKDDRNKLFEPFFTKGKIDGTGLGLAIARKIVDAHGGKIYCRSSRDKGTEFVFTLPTSNIPDLSNAPLGSWSRDYRKQRVLEPAISHGTVSGDDVVRSLLEKIDCVTKIKIAILDDECIYRDHLKTHITSFPELTGLVEICEYSSSHEMLMDMYKGQKFDAFVIDVDLGVSNPDGFKVVEVIRQKDKNAKICIHSNRGALEFGAKALESGANLFLPKPMTKTHMLKILASVVDTISFDRVISKKDSSPNARKDTIAIIDDEDLFLKVWRKELSDKSVECFSSFEEFSNACTSGFDLANLECVITDYYLENGNSGLEIARLVKKIEPRLPVFICTNRDIKGEDHGHLFSGSLPKIPQDGAKVLRSFLSDLPSINSI